LRRTTLSTRRGPPMLYALHEAGYHASTPLRLGARVVRDFWSSPANPIADTRLGRTLYAGADLFTNVTRRYGRPEWGIDSVTIDGSEVRVRPVVEWSSPWVKLTHFSRDMADMRRAGRKTLEPAVLIVAPLSGHYATLLRGTVQAFLQDHEVYVTDWSNARDVPMLEGRFDSTIISTMSGPCWAPWVRARTWSRSASPGRRSWPPPP
jgi:poly(3-hydroxybutyrate) depolymerase